MITGKITNTKFLFLGGRGDCIYNCSQQQVALYKEQKSYRKAIAKFGTFMDELEGINAFLVGTLQYEIGTSNVSQNTKLKDWQKRIVNLYIQLIVDVASYEDIINELQKQIDTLQAIIEGFCNGGSNVGARTAFYKMEINRLITEISALCEDLGVEFKYNPIKHNSVVLHTLYEQLYDIVSKEYQNYKNDYKDGVGGDNNETIADEIAQALIAENGDNIIYEISNYANGEEHGFKTKYSNGKSVDFNNDAIVNKDDVTEIQNAVKNRESLTPEEIEKYDITGDGIVNSEDITAVQSMIGVYDDPVPNHFHGTNGPISTEGSEGTTATTEGGEGTTETTDDTENTQYVFSSYADAEGNQHWADGKVKATGEKSIFNDVEYSEVEVLYNTVEGFAGQKFYIVSNAVVGDNLYELFNSEGTSQNIWIKIVKMIEYTEVSDNNVKYMFSSYADAEGNQHWADGKVKQTATVKIDNVIYEEVEVISNSVEGFAGQKFLVENGSNEFDSNTLYKLFDILGNAQEIWIKITGVATKTIERIKVEDNNIQYVFSSYADAECTQHWADGKVKQTATVKINNVMYEEVEVISNSVEGFAGQKFLVVNESNEFIYNTPYQLYNLEGESQEIWIKITGTTIGGEGTTATTETPGT